MIWALNAGSEATCIHTIDGLIKADQPSYVPLTPVVGFVTLGSFY
jgi:hypothetical protein